MDVKQGYGYGDGEIEADSSWKGHLTKEQDRREVLCLL